MDDTKSMVPYWVSRKPRWLLEVWSDDAQKDVCLYLQSKGQRRRKYGDWIPRKIAYALLRDLRDVQQVLTRIPPRPFLRLFRRRPDVFRECPDYTLRLWDRADDLHGSVTIHPALADNRWIVRLTRNETRLFVDDLSAALATLERLRQGTKP